MRAGGLIEAWQPLYKYDNPQKGNVHGVAQKLYGPSAYVSNKLTPEQHKHSTGVDQGVCVCVTPQTHMCLSNIHTPTTHTPLVEYVFV